MRIALCVLLIAAGCGRQCPVSNEWISMGTVAKVSFKGDAQDDAAEKNATELAAKTFARVEEALSVHNPESEISRYVSVEKISGDMRPCFEAAFAVSSKSGGAFNPFWRGNGKCPDLGGIAKGFAVDLAAKRIAEAGCAKGDVLVDLGGNLKAVSGTWRTGIADPKKPGAMARIIVLTNGMACATSGEYARGKHIRDGRTGVPVTNGVASVTVIHPSSAMLADALSTTLFVLGREEGEAFLKRHYPEARAEWILVAGE